MQGVILLPWTLMFEWLTRSRLSFHPPFLLDDFRLFAGDLGNEVTDEILTKTFSKYPSFLKAKVVRDKRTDKSRGYGFISFSEPDDFARAWKEMNGNYFLICCYCGGQG